MDEPESLAEQFDAFELQLLRSTKSDAPKAGAASKTLAALGVSPMTAAASNAGLTVSVARSLTAWSVLKGLVIGALTGGTLMFAAELAQHPAKPPVPSPSALSLAPSAPAARIANPASRAPEPTAPIASVSGPSSERSSPPRHAEPLAVTSASEPAPPLAPLSSVATFAPVPSAAPSLEAPKAPSIADQVLLIDRARRSLRDGQARAALSDAIAYAERWPNGSLAIEAVIVRVEAELALGDRAAAERDAKRVISALPGSRYATRLRQLFSPPLVE